MSVRVVRSPSNNTASFGPSNTFLVVGAGVVGVVVVGAREVGVRVGASVVGTRVGERVGDCVGWAVGLRVGKCVGAAVVGAECLAVVWVLQLLVLHLVHLMLVLM